MQGLTVRPEPVEGWVVKPIMVRQAHHERLNLKLSRLTAFSQLNSYSVTVRTELVEVYRSWFDKLTTNGLT